LYKSSLSLITSSHSYRSRKIRVIYSNFLHLFFLAESIMMEVESWLIILDMNLDMNL